jgi:hypothetical protein
MQPLAAGVALVTSGRGPQAETVNFAGEQRGPPAEQVDIAGEQRHFADVQTRPEGDRARSHVVRSTSFGLRSSSVRCEGDSQRAIS